LDQKDLKGLLEIRVYQELKEVLDQEDHPVQLVMLALQEFQENLVHLESQASLDHLGLKENEAVEASRVIGVKWVDLVLKETSVKRESLDPKVHKDLWVPRETWAAWAHQE